MECRKTVAEQLRERDAAERNGNSQAAAPFPAGYARGDSDETPRAGDQVGDHPGDPPGEALDLTDVYDLIAEHRNLRRPVLEGLLRLGETLNLIAATKVGKSWLSYALAYAVVMGGRWLGTFQATRGRVLLIDNELHKETSAHRLERVAKAMGVDVADLRGHLMVVNLRGKLKSLPQIATSLMLLKPGEFDLIIVDAWYRTIPEGSNENDNGDTTARYNLLDRLADHLQCAFVLIHHSSKGDQAGKAVTDVGAGAGAQSRAADTHMILRPHEEEDVVVLDASTRSWPPLTPMCLRWDFPVWIPASGLDPAALRVRTAKAREKDQEAEKAVKDDGVRLLEVLDQHDQARAGMKIVEIEKHVPWGRKRTERAAQALVNEGVCAWVDFETSSGRGRTQAAAGLRRC